jgi:hypothetical protein
MQAVVHRPSQLINDRRQSPWQGVANAELLTYRYQDCVLVKEK